MPKKKMSEEQIDFTLRQADRGTPVAEICRRPGVFEASFYRWKKVYAGMGVSEIRRPKQLEDENTKLDRQRSLSLRIAVNWELRRERR